MSVNTLPANLPDTPDAKLPATYEAARHALVECHRVDEAWMWQNKAAALAAYARMARDTALRDMALRIQALAIKRAGELLRMIPAAQGANQNIREGDHPKVTRESAASEAGLSEHQRKTALRVANVPQDEFERALEGDRPPTVGELAEWGTTPRPLSNESREATAAISNQRQYLLELFERMTSQERMQLIEFARTLVGVG